MSDATQKSPADGVISHAPPGALKPSKAAFWAGWVLSILPVPLLLMSAGLKLVKASVAVEGFRAQGWPDGVLVPLGIVELACTILYVIPQTAVLGAILLVGYLGGATATHARLGEPFIIPVVMGVVLWLGLYLRDPRVRELTPLRTLR